jgi:hypothetical protein
MTSQVNPNNIDGTYPVAGQDNDSQGFRDNFTNIRNNFTFTKAEIEDLQNKVVLKSALLNTTLSNDFAGNAMVNPALTGWRETYNNIGSVSGSVTINFTNGNFQKITMSGSTTLNFSFPLNTVNQYASIKLWVNNTNSAWTLTLPSAVTLNNPLSIAGAAGSPPVITFTADTIANNNDFLFEFYTVDGGTTIGIHDHTRNRDIALSTLAVGGTFTANGNVILGSGAASNVVVAATTASPAGSTTAGALVVAGGAAVAGNVNVGANLVTQGGRINQNYAYITLTNNQNYFANIQHQTQFFDTASSATIANARIALPAAAIDGREINMSFLAPITTLWVNSGNTALVRWMPNNTVSSGNVHVKFVYSASIGTWLRSA